MLSKPEHITFDPATYTLLLTVEQVELSNCIAEVSEEAFELGLQLKEEFHITVIGFRVGKQIKEMYATLQIENRIAIENGIRTFANSINWEFTPGGQRALYIEKKYKNKQGGFDLRKSIIHLLEMPAVQDFYKELNDVFGTTFDIPPPHVTLFVGEDGQGIGIDSEKVLRELSPKEIF